MGQNHTAHAQAGVYTPSPESHMHAARTYFTWSRQHKLTWHLGQARVTHARLLTLTSRLPVFPGCHDWRTGELERRGTEDAAQGQGK